MSQKTALKNRPDPRKPKDTPKPSVLPVVDETPVEEMTGSEKFIESITPHMTTIALVAIAAVLAVIAWAVLKTTSFAGRAGKWQEFSQAQFIDRRTGDTQNLDDVAESYPNSEAGLMSMLFSGDIQLKKGLALLGRDRDKGFLAIQKAKASFQSIVDADDSLKTTLVNQKAQYCLAYAHESLGEMSKANTLYEEFVEAAPDAPLADSARRGIERCSDDKYVTLYQTFKNYEEEVIGEAPGPSIPEKTTPGSFPVVDAGEGVVPPKGDDTDTRMNADVIAEEKAAAEKAAAEKAAAEKAAMEKAAAEKAAAEKAAAEKAAAEKAAMEKAAAEKAAREKAAAEKAAAEKAAMEKAAAEKAAMEKAAAEKAAMEKAAAEKAAMEKAAAEKAAAEKAAMEKAAAEKAAMEKAAAEKAAAEKAAAEKPAVESSALDAVKEKAEAAKAAVEKAAEAVTGE